VSTFIAVIAGIGTFLITQLVAAFALGVLSTTSRLAYLLIGLNPYKFVLRLLVWAICGWLGALVFNAVA
jgi:hypothetical protein